MLYNDYLEQHTKIYNNKQHNPNCPAHKTFTMQIVKDEDEKSNGVTNHG